ncbi:MAG: Nif3-like dinuclear metal center hexameric protein [Peptoniphilus sp.]|nr:Nif3-like dinuclear metal center hexameric protein [Peptoniphilus sp.]
MEYKVKDIVDFMKGWAREEYQEEWDNSGYQIAFEEERVSSVVLALDLTDRVVDEAIKRKAKLIITHHPLFFEGIKRISDGEYRGKNIIKLIKNDTSLYSAHTSLDIAEQGVNHKIIEQLGLKDPRGLSLTEGGYFMGLYVQNYEKYSFEDIISKLRHINANLKIYGKIPTEISKIAVCAGAGFDLVDDALKAGAQIFITGDIKYHQAQIAYEKDLCLIDIGHHEGEIPILDEIEKKLRENFDIEIYKYTKNDFKVDL